MKTAINSKSIPCENMDKFTEAKKLSLDGIVMDYDDSNLERLPSRNFYILQSIKMNLPIIGIHLGFFQEFSIFSNENEQEILKVTAEAVEICSNMKVPLLILPLTGASRIESEEQLIQSVRRLRFAVTFASGLNVSIGIYGDMSTKDRISLMRTVGQDNLVDITDGFDGWQFEAL